MLMPSARATTRHRQAEHTVVKAVSVTAATTAGQVTARRPSSNGAAPTSRSRNQRTVTAAATRSNGKPRRRTTGLIPTGTGTECWRATPAYNGSAGHIVQPSSGDSAAAWHPAAVNQRDRGLVDTVECAAVDGYADGGAVR